MFHFAEFLPRMIGSPRHAAPGASDGLPGREAWEGAGPAPPRVHTLACLGDRFQVSFLFRLPCWVLPSGSHDLKPPEQMHLPHAQLRGPLQLPTPLPNQHAGVQGHLQEDLSSPYPCSHSLLPSCLGYRTKMLRRARECWRRGQGNRREKRKRR